MLFRSKATGATLRNFLAKKGPRQGAARAVFCPADMYLELLEIKQGKPWIDLEERLWRISEEVNFVDRLECLGRRKSRILV